MIEQINETTKILTVCFDNGEKKEVDPSILGGYFDKPKKETVEPETWGAVPSAPKAIPIEVLMEEEARKAGKKK